MMLRWYFHDIFVVSLSNQNIVGRITNNSQTNQFTPIKYHILILVFLYSVSTSYDVLRNIVKRLCLGSNRIKNCLINLIPVNYLFLMNNKLKISKNESKTIFKIYKNILQIRSSIKTKTITMFIIPFLGLSIICIFGNIEKIEQTMSANNTIFKLLKNTINAPIFLQFSPKNIMWGVRLVCESERIDQGRSYYQNNIEISHCFFSRSSVFSGNGGVIFVQGGSYSMNIGFSMFYNCLADYGGAISFNSDNLYLLMICANRCHASYWGHFAYLVPLQMNQVEYLSISACSHISTGIYPIRMIKGIQRIDNTNSSMNNAFKSSGISQGTPSSFTSSHCTFSNNKASDSMCLNFFSPAGTISISYANIIHNNSPSDYGVVLVDGVGLTKMMYCVFQNNDNYLFYVWSGSLEVSHSFIEHLSSSFSISNPVSTSSNNLFTYRETHQLQFFNSLHCNADFPLPQRTLAPTRAETMQPTRTLYPTRTETMQPTRTNYPTRTETIQPTRTNYPTRTETIQPTRTNYPTRTETMQPTRTNYPTRTETIQLTRTNYPTRTETIQLTRTNYPTRTETIQPTRTNYPTRTETIQPTRTNYPTRTETMQPTRTNYPTRTETIQLTRTNYPTRTETIQPTRTNYPTRTETMQPTRTNYPTRTETIQLTRTNEETLRMTNERTIDQSLSVTLNYTIQMYLSPSISRSFPPTQSHSPDQTISPAQSIYESIASYSIISNSSNSNYQVDRNISISDEKQKEKSLYYLIPIVISALILVFIVFKLMVVKDDSESAAGFHLEELTQYSVSPTTVAETNVVIDDNANSNEADDEWIRSSLV